MSDPTICPTHNFQYRICESCKCVHCVRCQPAMKQNYAGWYRCDGSTRAANNYEVEQYGVTPPGE
jgi:hypothetical protein